MVRDLPIRSRPSLPRPTSLLLIASNASGYRGRSTQRLNQRRAVEALDIPVVSSTADGDWASAAEEALALVPEGALPAEAMRRPEQPDGSPARPRPPRPVSTPDRAVIVEAVRLLQAAERPTIVAGRGAARAGIADRLAMLGERLGAPLGTTLAARGLFHGAYVGLVGGLGTPASTHAAQSCDAVLVVGAALNGLTTDEGAFFSAARVIRIDRSPDAPSSIPVHVMLAGDAAGIIETLLEEHGSEQRTPVYRRTIRVECARQ